MENRQRQQAPAAQADGGIGSGGITPRQKLQAYALRLLSLRSYSQAEVVAKLGARTTDANLISEVIAWLTEHKFLDDRKFAAWLVESYSRFRPKGKRLLELKLKQKGISPEIIAETLSAVTDEVAPATAFIAKKSGLLDRLPEKQGRQKIIQLLSSRGFSWSVIETVLKNRYNRED